MIEERSYLEKHLHYPVQIDEPVARDLGLAVVIPAFREETILPVLDSLWQCKRPKSSAEVIVVINCSELAPDEVVLQNQQIFWEAEKWKKKHTDDKLKFHILNFQSIPDDYANAQTARTIGVYEAVQRFTAINNLSGIVISLDADCTVEENYLVSIEQHFEKNPESNIANLYFEHKLKGEEKPRLYEGVTRYELFLRYYVQGMKYARLPYATHQKESCLAVRAKVIPNPLHNEDFNILESFGDLKIADITNSTVYPSTRLSDRKPYGTGRTLSRWMYSSSMEYLTHHPLVFADLRLINDNLLKLYKASSLNGLNEFFAGLNPASVAFLSAEGLHEHWKEMKGTSLHYDSFKKKFYEWLDRHMLLQYIHFCKNFYGEIPVEEAAGMLLHMMEPSLRMITTPYLMLNVFRQLDRGRSTSELLKDYE